MFKKIESFNIFKKDMERILCKFFVDLLWYEVCIVRTNYAWLFSTFLTLDQSLVTVDGGIGWADVVTVPELLAGTITSLSAVCPFAPVCGDTACGKIKSAEVQNRIRNRQEVSYF